MKKVLVTGSTSWTDRAAIYKALAAFCEPGDVVVHGAARGADRLAHSCALELKLVPKPYPAKWLLYGRQAGPIRNRHMLRNNPDVCRVFAFPLPGGSGTWDMVEVARKLGIPVEVLKEEACRS